jgi:hypothetical protein
VVNRMANKGRQGRLGGWISTVLALVWILGSASLLPSPATAQTLTVAETENLVRGIHFEGLPEEMALRVGPAGAERLIEMLNDPGEGRSHANTLKVLGLCGDPDAYQAIVDWASRPLEGEIDRDTFRAWQMLPYALGHVAKHDRRALARLEAQLDEDAPTWTFRHHRGARLHRQSRRAAATALGMTGLPEAGEVLDRRRQRTTDIEFEEHLLEVRAMHRGRAAGRSRR